MKELFDVTEFLYQKFLLDIYKHCERLGITDITGEEKEEMALEMVGFVGKVVNSLENGTPLIKIDEKEMKRISKYVVKRVYEDDFAKSVLDYYIKTKKINKKEAEACVTTATIAILNRGRKNEKGTLGKKIVYAKPMIFRIASLISPAVALQKKIILEDFHKSFSCDHDLEFMKYIG